MFFQLLQVYQEKTENQDFQERTELMVCQEWMAFQEKKALKEKAVRPLNFRHSFSILLEKVLNRD